MSMSSNWMPMETSNGPKPSAEKKMTMGHSLIQTSDGGYAIAGYTKSFGAGEADVYVVKLDANGNLQWTKTIGGKERTGATPSFRPPMAATPSPASPNPSAQEKPMSMSSSWMPMVTSNGPKPSADQRVRKGNSLIQTSDGGYAIAGTTESFGAGEKDVYVVKLDKNGNACCAVSQTSRVGSGGRLGSAYPLHRQRRHPHLPHPQHQLRRHPLQPVPIAPPPCTPRSTLPSLSYSANPPHKASSPPPAQKNHTSPHTERGSVIPPSPRKRKGPTLHPLAQPSIPPSSLSPSSKSLRSSEPKKERHPDKALFFLPSPT
jgi:hypothetical protein